MIRKVLLSAKIDPDDPDLAFRQLQDLQYPVMVSPKIDGIRCHVENSPVESLPVVLSRRNKAIPNLHIRSFLANPKFLAMDGELVVGPPNSDTCYNLSQSGIMSQGGHPDFKFLVFDYTGAMHNGFYERYQLLNLIFKRIAPHWPVKLVHQRFVYNVDELLKYEAMMVSKGWEGIMIRSVDGIYKEGRSTLREGILIKLKRFIDGEAEILGAYEQETNLNEAVINEVGRSKRSSHSENKICNGHLGGLHVRDLSSGIAFDVGTFSGFTKVQRRLMWDGFCADPSLLLGKTVKYKHFPIGAKDKPRHPILKGFRDPIDFGGEDAADTE